MEAEKKNASATRGGDYGAFDGWNWLYRVTNFLARLVFFLPHPRKVYGADNMPAQGGVLVLCNHRHFHDVFSVARCFRRRVVFMGKRELFDAPILGWLYRRYGAFPVDRAGTDMGAVRRTIALLKEGRVVAVFPEGTRNKGEGMGQLKQGAVLIAKAAGAAVLPMYISHDERWFRATRVRIGQPFRMPEGRMDSAYLAANTADVRARMLALADSGQTLPAGGEQ